MAGDDPSIGRVVTGAVFEATLRSFGLLLQGRKWVEMTVHADVATSLDCRREDVLTVRGAQNDAQLIPRKVRPDPAGSAPYRRREPPSNSREGARRNPKGPDRGNWVRSAKFRIFSISRCNRLIC